MLTLVVKEMMMTVGLGSLMSALVGFLTYLHMEGYVEDLVEKIFVKSFGFMKTVVDMAAMAVLSGAFAAMLVALKYYVVNAVETFVESMTGLGYADDP